MINLNEAKSNVLSLSLHRLQHVILILLCSILTQLFSQEDYKITTLTIEEQLTLEDEYDSEFGRFDAFDFEIDGGERLKLSLESRHFSPSLVLIAPNDSTYLFDSGVGNKPINIDITLEESGTWLLVVRGDSLSLGEYKMQCYWAEANSLHLEEDTDVCDMLNFLVAHANADFAFLKQPANAPNVWHPTVRPHNAVFAEISPPGKEKYLARLVSSNNRQRAEDRFTSMSARMNFCAGAVWTSELTDWKDSVTDHSRYKTFTMREKDRPDFRYVQVRINDHGQSPPSGKFRYEVDLLVSRNHL